MKLALVLAVMILMASVVWAGDKEELQYQNMNLRIQNLSLQIQMIINDRADLVKEMQKQGYVFDQQGNFTLPKKEEKKEPAKK
jgi:hypothetical protein